MSYSAAYDTAHYKPRVAVCGAYTTTVAEGKSCGLWDNETLFPCDAKILKGEDPLIQFVHYLRVYKGPPPPPPS